MKIKGRNSKLILKRLQTYLIAVIALSFLFSCATAVQQPGGKINSLGVTDISEGLPADGQWRQNIALADMDGDGLLDIVAPPPRKAKEEENMPHVFLRGQSGWKKVSYTFPTLGDFGYGGIAVGDMDGDGYPDIVLAVHDRRIILLKNDGGKGFTERPFAVKEPFRSRTVEMSDINADGRLDIIALSSAAFSPGSYKPNGILLAIKSGDMGWDMKILEGSAGLFGDSMAVADVKGTGKKDIIIAPLMANREDATPVWFGDGEGNFRPYKGDVIAEYATGNVVPSFVRAGDLDADGKDELVFKVSGFGVEPRSYLAAYKWDGEGFANISGGLEAVQNPVVFNLADADGDGKKELIVLSIEGMRIYKYTGRGWIERGQYELSFAETAGASDLKAGRNGDGSFLIVYSLGLEGEDHNRGLRAYLMNPEATGEKKGK